MTMLVIATVAFLATHFVTSTPLRPALVNAMGEWPYRGVYSLVAFVTLYRGQVKAFETSPVSITDGMDPKSKTIPIRLSVPLGQLTPGQYDCQVTILYPGAQKASFWKAPIMLIP